MSSLRQYPKIVKERINFLPQGFTSSFKFKNIFIDEKFIDEMYHQRFNSHNKMNPDPITEELWVNGMLKEAQKDLKKYEDNGYPFDSQINLNLFKLITYLNKKINQLNESKNQISNKIAELNELEVQVENKQKELKDLEIKLKEIENHIIEKEEEKDSYNKLTLTQRLLLYHIFQQEGLMDFYKFSIKKDHQADLIRVLDRSFNNTKGPYTNHYKIWKALPIKGYPRKYYTALNLKVIKEILVKLNKADIFEKIEKEVIDANRKTHRII